MKKLLYLFIVVGILIAASSCSRDVCPGHVNNQYPHTVTCEK